MGWSLQKFKTPSGKLFLIFFLGGGGGEKEEEGEV